MKKVVTFGIAAYNAEKCLEKCLSSFLCQSVLEEMEIIVVDDGSTDSTSIIAEKFVCAYPQSFRLICQENGGHGAAVDAAVAAASGIYFKAVDSDDWVLTENLPSYLDVLKSTCADAVISSYHTVDFFSGKKKLFSTKCKYCGKVVSISQLMEVYHSIASCCSYHGLTYRLSVYRKAGFCLSRKIFYEDNEYATLPFSQVKTVELFPDSIYQYQIGDANQSVAFHNQVKRIEQIATVIDKIVGYRRSIPLTEAQNDYFLKKLATVTASYYAVSLVKNPDKNEGRHKAEEFHCHIEKIAPEINCCVQKKYKTLRLLNRLHLPAEVYQKVLDTEAYKQIIRKFWVR